MTSIHNNLYMPYVFSVPLYNLEPAPGEPARFGFQTPAGPVILDTSVRTGGDYGVTVTVPNIVELPVHGQSGDVLGCPFRPSPRWRARQGVP